MEVEHLLIYNSFEWLNIATLSGCMIIYSIYISKTFRFYFHIISKDVINIVTAKSSIK